MTEAECCQVREDVTSLGADAGPGPPLRLSLRHLQPGEDGVAAGAEGHTQGIPEADCEITRDLIFSSVELIFLLQGAVSRDPQLGNLPGLSQYQSQAAALAGNFVGKQQQQRIISERTSENFVLQPTRSCSPWRPSCTGYTSRAPGASSTTWTRLGWR